MGQRELSGIEDSAKFRTPNDHPNKHFKHTRPNVWSRILFMIELPDKSCEIMRFGAAGHSASGSLSGHCWANQGHSVLCSGLGMKMKGPSLFDCFC